LALPPPPPRPASTRLYRPNYHSTVFHTYVLGLVQYVDFRRRYHRAVTHIHSK
jgi:hypothetical protein